MDLIYRGPASVLVVNGNRVRPGDKASLTDEQVKRLAIPPLGSGIHIFDIDDKTFARLHPTPVNPLEDALKTPDELVKQHESAPETDYSTPVSPGLQPAVEEDQKKPAKK